MRTTFAVVLALGIITQSTMSAAHQKNPATVVATESDTGSRLQGTVGSLIIVKLPARLGTGYSWRIVESGKGLRFLSQSQQSDKKQHVGKSDIQIFRFRAYERGDFHLTFYYTRSWVRNQSRLKSYNLDI